MTITVPVLDLKAQYQSIKDEIDQAVLGVMESGYFVLGPNVKALEAEVAEYVVRMAADPAGMITGDAIVIDGSDEG